MGELKPDALLDTAEPPAARATEVPLPKERTNKPSNVGGATQPKAQKVVDSLAPRFGHSFSDVAIRTGEEADLRTATIGAPAMAVGKTIFLSSEVDPASPDGTKIVAHEMAHVIQQTAPAAAGETDSTRGPAASHPAALEAEAHKIGDAVAAGAKAAPKLRTQGEVAQGYDSPEHRSTGNEVDSILATGGTTFGGVSTKERAEQKKNEDTVGIGPHTPDLQNVQEATEVSGKVAVPDLPKMLARDQGIEMLKEGSRNLTISARNFKMQHDAAGPYMALEIDPATKQAVRYDVPVSPGDLTAINGDLYGSIENMRKAPADEIITMRNLVEQEARWEQDIARGKADAKDEPNFDALYEAATKWRHQPVYVGGREVGKQGQASGGDSRSYMDLALHNHAHFGQATSERHTIEVKVKDQRYAELARGKQGNLASGSEEAWMNGHARARKLAKESYDLKHAKKGSEDYKRAASDDYGHETTPQETGVLNPENVQPAAPKDNRIDSRTGHVGSTSGLKRSSNIATPESKLNDAYVENAGADHYLTDAFAAGHQVVRNGIGDAIDQFVKDKGGKNSFLDFITTNIQQAAINDPKHAKGKLKEFQDASRSSLKRPIARGGSPINDLAGIDGLKQELEHKMDHDALRAFGAKVVHDYYNRHGMIVENGKGMRFVIKGDGHLEETPEARRIIALAVLESRNQITEMAATGSAASAMDVWDYAPAEDRTFLTENSGAFILQKQLSDGVYLWNLLKDDFDSVPAAEPASTAQQESAANKTEAEIDQEGREGDFDRCDVVDEMSRCHVIDAGQPPVRQWFRRRREYLQKHVAEAEKDHSMISNYKHPTADDGTKIKNPKS